MKVNTFLGYFELETGGLALGWLNLIANILLIIVCMYFASVDPVEHVGYEYIRAELKKQHLESVTANEFEAFVDGKSFH